MEKCHAATEKKSASCTPQIGHLASYITYKTFCSCQVQTTVPKHIFKNTETAPCAKIFMVHECVILGVDRPHPCTYSCHCLYFPDNF